MKRLFFFFAFTTAILSQTAFAETYTIDKDHSTVDFKIRHLFSFVRGTFRDFEGAIQYDLKNPDANAAEATIKAESIDTNVSQRDNHLRSADFFDVQKFPTLSFKSTKYTKESDTKGKLEGVLTIHGVEKPVVLDVEIQGIGKDPWGNTRAGFTGTVTVNRKDFGLNWNKTIETGGVLVGDEVEITLNIEGLLKEDNAETAQSGKS